MQNLISELLAGIQPDELVQPDVDMQPDQEMPPDLDVSKNLIPNGVHSVKSNISELESEYLSGKHRELESEYLSGKYRDDLRNFFLHFWFP